MSSPSSSTVVSSAAEPAMENAPEAGDDGAAVLRARALYAERFMAEHRGRLSAPDRRAGVSPAFDFFVTGHETPESVFEMVSGEPESTTERSLTGSVEVARLKTLAQLSHRERGGAPVKRNIGLLACSDPRHMLQTLMLSQRPGIMAAMTDWPSAGDAAAAADDDEDYDTARARLPELQLNFHLNDVTPEAVAKSVMIIYLL
jgi:hypothetical protein